MNFYVFPTNIRLKININDDILSLFYMEQCVNINMSVLRDGSSTMVLYNPAQNLLYTMYNFREILQVLNLAPTDFFPMFNQLGLLQMDKCGGEIFCKIFGQPASDTTDFSACCHMTTDYIHPLDWQYSWTCHDVAAELVDGNLLMTIGLWKSDFWVREVYASHGGQVAKLEPGTNRIQFAYVPGELVYLGEPNCRYTARALDIPRLLNEKREKEILR